MTDRELLEGAARATFEDWAQLRYPLDWVRDCVGDWNPLTDDGDALRLAVKLGMTIAPFPVGARVRFQNHILDTCEVEVSGDDPCAATRHAIVRAAAEIGKAMP